MGGILEPCWSLFSMFFSLLLRIDFLFVFGSFWSAILRRFWSPNRIKMRICDYLVFIGFPLVFLLFFAFRRVLCSSYFGSFFASFLASIFCCFLDRFWGHFGRLSGVQLGHFWHRFLASIFDRFLDRFGCQKGGSHTHPRAHMHTLFSIDFWLIFACRSKSRPRAAKSGPRAAKSGPRAAQERPRPAQERPRATKSSPRAAKNGQ